MQYEYTLLISWVFTFTVLKILLLFLDFQPEVNFYWMRGETVVPRGHRQGRIDTLKFQIDDKPHCQIRISKQLSEV